MKKVRGKENTGKKQYSLVPIAHGKVSDSDEDLLPDDSPPKAKRSAVKRLPFGSSQAKRNAMVTTQVKVHKPKYEPMMHQQQRNRDVERHDKLRSEYATHKRSSNIDV